MSGSSALEEFRAYDKMIQKTIKATERANALRDELIGARTVIPSVDPEEVTLPPYNFNYISPLSRRKLATPPIWKTHSGLPLSEDNSLPTTFSSNDIFMPLLQSPKKSQSIKKSPSKSSPTKSLKLSPTRHSQKCAVERLSNNNSKKVNSSPTLDRDLLRYRPIVQGDSICGELLVYGFVGSKTIDRGLQKRLPRNIGLNSKLSLALSGKLSWGKAYIVLDPGSELLACYTDRMSSKAIKIIRLNGSKLISIGRKRKKVQNSSLSVFCWIIQEAGTTNSATYTFGVPSSDVAKMWTHSLRFTITQKEERGILMEERKRKRDYLSQTLTSMKHSPTRYQISTLPNTWQVGLHEVEKCSSTYFANNNQIEKKDPNYNEEKYRVEYNRSQTTAEFLKEMGFAVVQDVYKGRIIGNTINTVAVQAAIRIQSFVRGCMMRNRYALRRGKKGIFVRGRSSYHQAVLRRSVVAAEIRKLRPTKPYVLSEHMERLLAFAPRTSRNAARKIQSMVRGVVVRKSFLKVFTIQRNVCCSIQGWYRIYRNRWIRKQLRSATRIQQDVRTWIAKCRLKELIIETRNFIKHEVIGFHLAVSLDKALSQRCVRNWLRTQLCQLRLRRFKRSTKIIFRFWRFVTGDKFRKLFRTAVGAVVRVQAAVRRKKQVEAYKKKVGVTTWAIRKIIRWWRSHKPRIAARTIQSVWRMYIGGRPFHATKKAVLILVTRVRGWSSVRTYKRQLSAAVVIESAVRRMVARRQVKLSVWQIVRIQTLYRVKRARRVLKKLEDSVAIRRLQTWWRCVSAKCKFKIKKLNEIIIFKWWAGLRFFSKLQSVIRIANKAANLIQSHARGLISRVMLIQDELNSLQEFVELGTEKFVKTIHSSGYIVRNQPSSMSLKRIKELYILNGEGGKTNNKRRHSLILSKHLEQIPSTHKESYVAIATFNGSSFRLDRIQSRSYFHDDRNEENKTNKKKLLSSLVNIPQQRCQLSLSSSPNLKTSCVTIRELTLAILVHPWLRRHRMGVNKLIKYIAQCPDLYETFIVVKENNYDDMKILERSNQMSPSNVVLVSALEKFPVRVPRSIANTLMRIGQYQTSQMTVADFLQYAGISGNREKTIRTASRSFINFMFTTDIRQMQTDQRQMMIQTLTNSEKRDGFNKFLESMHVKFSKYHPTFSKLTKIGDFILSGFANAYEGLRSLQIITRPPYLLFTITKRLSKIKLATLTSSDSFAIHDDAGAYFLTKQLVEFADAFINMDSDWSLETINKCKQLELRICALKQCIPDRYRSYSDFEITSRVVELDSVLGSLYYDRETFVPIFLECIDMLNKLGAIQSYNQHTLQVKRAEIDRIKRKQHLNLLISQRRGGTDTAPILESKSSIRESKNNEEDSEGGQVDDQIQDQIKYQGKDHEEDNSDLEDDPTNNLFELLEYDTTRMTSHLSSMQQYVSSTDLLSLTQKMSTIVPMGVGFTFASFDFSIQLQSVMTNWVLDSASKMDTEKFPKLDFLQRVPFQIASLHAVMELWESVVENVPTERFSLEERAHLDTQFISTMCELLNHLGETLQSIDVHKNRCEAQRIRCKSYMNWVRNEKKRCLKHCQESRGNLKKCSKKQEQAKHVVDVASSLIIAPLERPDGVDEKRVSYFQSAVALNSAAVKAANVELIALEETLEGICTSSDNCNTTLHRISSVQEQQDIWLKHCKNLHCTIMTRLESRVPEIHSSLENIKYVEQSVETVDHVQFVRAATRALDDFEQGEQHRNELLLKKEASIHEMRSQSRIFRKQCREYLLHLWFALDKNIIWFCGWENEYKVKIEDPCAAVEAKIRVLYDQVKKAKKSNQERLKKLQKVADSKRRQWHITEKQVTNFWWFKFTQNECRWYNKWQQWHETIRKEKKVYEDRRKLEVKELEKRKAVIEARQISVTKFNNGDIVEAKCVGWHQWWIGEIRRVEDLIPGSGKFTYFVKFQDGERIRGVEERRIRHATNNTLEHLFETYEESLCETSDYTNDSLGNPSSDESNFYFETDSDIPPLDSDDMNEEQKQKLKEKRERKKRILKARRKNAKIRQEKNNEKKNGHSRTKFRKDGINNGNDDEDIDEAGDEMESGDEFSSSSEEEPEPLQVILDYAIEFVESFPNAGRDDIPWEKLFHENGYGDQYSEYEVDRLLKIYNFKKRCYYPKEKIEKKDKPEEETKSIASELDYPPLIVAAHHGDLDRVRSILEADVNINMVADDGETPLFAAARNGHLDVVRLLAEKGARLNKCHIKTAETAALIARRAKQEDVVELLYELGARHVPRERPPIVFFGHRKFEDLEISETESERSSDRHSWDLDADHPLDFTNMFKPVSVRRKEKKDNRRQEKIAFLMKDRPLTKEERDAMLSSASKRTALQKWDTIMKIVSEAAADSRKLAASFTPPFKKNKWNNDTKKVEMDPIKCIPKKTREELLDALSHLHRLRLALEWKDHLTAIKFSNQLIIKFQAANISMNEAGGIMHFGNEPWNTLAATELTWLSQISSAVPTLNRLLLDLKNCYDSNILQQLKECDQMVNIGTYVDPSNLNDVKLRRLLKIFQRLSTLPKTATIRKTHLQLKKEAKEAALKLEAESYSGETKQQEIITEQEDMIKQKKPKSRDEREAEEAMKLASATLEEKVLETKMIVKAYSEFTKIKTLSSVATMRYHVRHRYNSKDGSITWEQFLDCATTPLKSRFEIRRMYHMKRASEAKSLMQKKFLKWAISFKHKMYLKYGQDLPGLRWIKRKAAAIRIQNWIRCLNEYYGFLKQKYVFDQCKMVQEAGLVLQNFFWHKFGGLVTMRERVTRDFVMVWDPESKGTFYVDLTTMMGRMNLPLSVKGCLREYSDAAKFKNIINIRAIRPRELNEKAEILNREKKIKIYATKFQKGLHKIRGKIFSLEQLVNMIEEMLEDDLKEHSLKILQCLVEFQILEENESGRYRVSVQYHSDIYVEEPL
jgi:uncharacterized protein